MEAKLAAVDLALCLPLMLLLNFSLFQYLITTFWKRWCEKRVRVLLGIALVSFARLVPFALPFPSLSRNLEKISEICTILTFLLQITILTRDVGGRIKIRSIWYLMWVGELLTAVCIMILCANVIDIFSRIIRANVVGILDPVARDASLLFIVIFRFYFLSMVKGFRVILAKQNVEIFCYLLFLTHSWPFEALNHLTGWSWHHVEGAWMRITVLMCLSTTIKSRLTSQNSKILLSVNGPKASLCVKDIPMNITGAMGLKAMKGVAPYATATASLSTVSRRASGCGSY